MKKYFTIIIFTALFLSAFIFGKNALAQNVTCTEGTRTGACRQGTSDCTPSDYDFIPDLLQCGIPYNGCCILKQPATPPVTPPAATPPAGTGAGGAAAGGAAAGSSGANTTPVQAPGGTGATTVNLGGIQKLILGSTSETKATDVAKFIGSIIKSILSVIGAFALLLVVYGGLLILTSHGNPEGISKGKKTITWAVIGVGVILGSYALVSYVITGIGGGAGGGGGTPTTTSTECTDLHSTYACAEPPTTCAPFAGQTYIQDTVAITCDGSTTAKCCYPQGQATSTNCKERHPSPEIWICADRTISCPTGYIEDTGATTCANESTSKCCVPGQAQAISGDECFTSSTTCYCPSRGGMADEYDCWDSACNGVFTWCHGTIDGVAPSSDNTGTPCKSICVLSGITPAP
ncbi:MAG: pilin [Candidatus Parcubacteria bacterium]|nr:pilin [Candidatus Parcubacteria bacterium]